MSKGKTRQYYRRVERKRLNASDDPAKPRHSYGYAIVTGNPKPAFNRHPDDVKVIADMDD